MKNKVKGLLIGILIGTLMTVFVANAATLYNVIDYGIKIVIDGKKLNPTDVNGNPVEPIIYNGTTYLPVRAVATALGKEVYWDGPNYTVYLGEMGGRLEYPSEYLTENNIGKRFSTASKAALVDNYGNSYTEGVYFVGDGTAEYLLNMKYSKLKGTLYIPKGEDSPHNGQVKVIADDKVIYTSPVMNKTSQPIHFDINIKGCNHLKIEFDNAGLSNWLNVYVGNAGFYQ